jgi:RecB family exonuclease
MEARLTFLVSRLGSHANGANVEQTLQECIRIVTGLLSEGAEGGVDAVERALKTIGIPLPPEVRYLEPDKPKGLAGPLYLSASSLNLYDGCPRQFYYKQVVRIPETSSFEARLGTAIHAALEAFHKRHPEPKPEHADELIALFETELADVQFAAEKEKQQASERGRKLLRIYLNEENARGTRVEMVEKEFTVSLGDDVTLTGKIDRVDRLPDGRVRVVDYKSGRMKSRPEYLDDFQMSIYAWAVQDELGEKLESVEIIGLKELKETKNGPALDRAALPWEDGSKYAITQERLVTVQQRVRDLIDGIRAGKFDPTPEERRCGWCRYNLLCGSAYGVKPSEIERHP